MQFLVAITLPFLAALVLSIGCSILWWRSFQSPWQFFVLALLLLLGLHRIVQVAAELFKLLQSEFAGYFLEYQKPPNLRDVIFEQITVEALVVAGLVVVAGIPLLVWLRTAMPKV